MLFAKDLMEVDRSTLFMVDKAEQTMYTIVADGAAPIVIPVTKVLAGAAYKSGNVVNIPDAYLDERFNPEVDRVSGYRTKSVLCFPIHNSRDECIAVIQLIGAGGLTPAVIGDANILVPGEPVVALGNAMGSEAPLTREVGTVTGFGRTVQAEDTAGATGTQTFTITISNTNDAPTITSTAGTAVDEDAVYSYSITTSDVDVGDTMAITFVCGTCDDGTGTNFLSITDNGDGTATLSGTPLNEDVGSHTVTVTATDGAGATDTETFTIVVTDTNDAPTIDSTHITAATAMQKLTAAAAIRIAAL